jgi:hypothetical protein
MPKKKETKKPSEVIEEQATVEVSRTILGKQEVSSEKLQVRPFVTTPAFVEVHMGAWFPTGDMRGAKVGVTVRVPCYIEEIIPVYKQTRRLVDKLVGREVNLMSGEDEGD